MKYDLYEKRRQNLARVPPSQLNEKKAGQKVFFGLFLRSISSKVSYILENCANDLAQNGKI